MKRIIERFKLLRETLAASEGFTLIELMIVVVIISILAGSAVMMFRGSVEKTKKSAVESDFATFESALEAYRLYHDTFPSSDDGLQKLMDEGLLKNKKKTLLDPWNNPYIYRYPAENGKDDPEIMSYGADGKPGGDGVNADLKNTEE